MRHIRIRLVLLACVAAGCGDDDDRPDAGDADAPDVDVDAPEDGPGDGDTEGDDGGGEECGTFTTWPDGTRLRDQHPRVVIDPCRLAEALARMTGPAARDPYRRWFDEVRVRQDASGDVDWMNLALLYRATGEARYLEAWAARLEATAAADDLPAALLFAVDLLWDELTDAHKTRVLEMASTEDRFYWHARQQSQGAEANWGYHSAHGVYPALAFAAAFAHTDYWLTVPDDDAWFDAENYLVLVREELGETGHFFRIENRVAGGPPLDGALPGSFGGMYDNLGYDSGEESASVAVWFEWLNATGDRVFEEALHDRWRGTFWQTLRLPHTCSTEPAWNAPEAGCAHARIWNTQTDWMTEPNVEWSALTAMLYGDGRMQHYVNRNAQLERTDRETFDGLWRMLLWYDDGLAEEPPETNPTATYFAGPGLVALRDDWSTDATFAVLLGGDHYHGGRRYEDAGSFLLDRAGFRFPHAGARIRNNADNDLHNWFVRRSASKNTLKVFDPAEPIPEDAWYDGPAYNLGGQLYDSVTLDPTGGLAYTPRADVVRFEHVPGDWSYAVVDAAAAYGSKVRSFQREAVFLRPGTLLLLDRVESADPAFRKVWTAHAVDRPEAAASPAESAAGMRAWDDLGLLTLAAPDNVSRLHVLRPAANRVVVRGGGTELVRAPLRAGEPVTSGIAPCDVPRWVEVFGAGDDAVGSVTLSGEALEGAGSTETVELSARRDSLTSVRTSADTTSLTDDTQHWAPDQWRNYMVAYRGPDHVARITGNDEHTLFGDFAAGADYWQYVIFRRLGNSYLHWRRIESISTADLDLAEVIVSTPHDFDTTDVAGTVVSFSPHTDGRDDQYTKRPDYGQWTIEVEPAGTPAAAAVFLHALTLRDPADAAPDVAPAPCAAACSAAVVDDRLVVFADGAEPLSAATAAVPRAGTWNVLLVDLRPGAEYHLEVAGRDVVLAEGSGGTPVSASAMGTAAAVVTVAD
ncbi:MAG: hypothetical protein JXB32_21380 [Deltaproteobacteria bacterium]|nr:hypothetical protein [Deltaproteobacteria bacterium]